MKYFKYLLLIIVMAVSTALSGQDIQLAGNTLDQYPWFEYVKAFNVNATVEVAIDPSLYPEIIGQTADIYLVPSKNVADWQSNPSLLDLTPGGKLTVEFNGTTVQENIFTITGPNELSSMAWVAATKSFSGLGHAYDIVIDMNRNGIFNTGDFIDGYGDEAGLYVIHDVTQPGPLAVTTSQSYSVGPIFGIPTDQTHEILYYPAGIALMEPLPLIVISHGSGHDYTWYDHIALHMASYGYIVMSHENIPMAVGHNHTDAILDLQGEIVGGVLNGKIDSTRIIWIGHSHGAINVARSYHYLVNGDYVPSHYTTESIVLISSMLPPGGMPEKGDLPHGSNFHLWTASGDDLVSGAAHFDLLQTYQLYERAEAWRMSTTVQGTGHAWFHNRDEQWGPWFEGPCSIEQEGTHLIQKGLFLPLIKHFAEGNIPATDFFYRQYERFHPIGVDISNSCFVVTNECRPNPADTNVFIIDDYQTEPGENTSSSGGPILFTVQNLTEGRLDDNNDDFSWIPSDPFNGATQAGPNDDSRGVVFDWDNTNRYYKWGVVPESYDFSNYVYVSFRGAQGTQHPYTLDVFGDLTFSLTLLDGNNVSSSINIGAYGGGLEQPYQRQGGWHNEMERIHIRITDFQTNGSGLDLTNVTAVRIDVGPSWGSDKGRVVIDELMLSGYNEKLITGITSNNVSQIQNIELISFPNPFSRNTTIKIEMPDKHGLIPVNLTIYDLNGSEIITLVDGNLAGTTTHKFNWNGEDKHGHQVNGGVYLVRATISGKMLNYKLVLIR